MSSSSPASPTTISDQEDAAYRGRIYLPPDAAFTAWVEKRAADLDYREGTQSKECTEPCGAAEGPGRFTALAHTINAKFIELAHAENTPDWRSNTATSKEWFIAFVAMRTPLLPNDTRNHP